MIQQAGYFWPDDVGLKWQHALKHVKSIEDAMARCAQKRTAVQAGGNVGLWPRRLADEFARVITFEPDSVSLACLRRNVPAWVDVRTEALGDIAGACGLVRQSLGSHYVGAGETIPVTTIDALELTDLDLLQLDIEGYEWHALMGARDTIERCHPVIQVELREFTQHYGKTDDEVRHLLGTLGYQEASQQPGNDVVFVWGGA